MQRESYPWHQLQPASLKAQQTVLPAMGALPRDWKWGADSASHAQMTAGVAMAPRG